MPGPAKKLDLDELVHRTGYSVEVQVRSPEVPEELHARLAQQAADARHERIKDLATHGAVLAGVAAVAIFCLYTTASARSSPDDKKWATAILTSIVSAGIGFLTGKATKSA